jgi:hypothetical protein
VGIALRQDVLRKLIGIASMLAHISCGKLRMAPARTRILVDSRELVPIPMDRGERTSHFVRPNPS